MHTNIELPTIGRLSQKQFHISRYTYQFIYFNSYLAHQFNKADHITWAKSIVTNEECSQTTPTLALSSDERSLYTAKFNKSH